MTLQQRMRMVSLRGSVLLLVALTLLGARQTQGHPEDLRLVHNGYEGLVITISDYVPLEHCNRVIHGLKVKNTTLY